MELVMRQITEQEVKAVAGLEAEGFPADEVYSFDTLMNLYRAAPDLTLGCSMFVGASRSNGQKYCHEDLKVHTPSGESVIIQSIVVKSSHRRKGIARRLLKEFLEKTEKEQHGVLRILLICKLHLVPFYIKAGFLLNGKSDVVLGKDQWYEMTMACGR